MKIIIIESCGQCEHSWHEYSTMVGRCFHPEGQKNKIIFYKKPIPEWCPLFDIKRLATEIHEQVHADASINDVIEYLQREK